MGFRLAEVSEIECRLREGHTLGRVGLHSGNLDFIEVIVESGDSGCSSLENVIMHIWWLLCWQVFRVGSERYVGYTKARYG